MGKGNWSVGLIIDERASAEQREALPRSRAAPPAVLWQRCLGCCWALMCVLFVVGVMNLVWVMALTAFVLFEKVGPAGVIVGRVAGTVMMGAGLVLILVQSL